MYSLRNWGGGEEAGFWTCKKIKETMSSMKWITGIKKEETSRDDRELAKSRKAFDEKSETISKSKPALATAMSRISIF